jgi:hypothetical protein
MKAFFFSSVVHIIRIVRSKMKFDEVAENNIA